MWPSLLTKAGSPRAGRLDSPWRNKHWLVEHAPNSFHLPFLPPAPLHPPGQVTFPGETQRSASLPQTGHQRSKEMIPPTLSLGPSEFMGLLTGAWVTLGKLCHRSPTPAWQTTQESCITAVLIPISHTTPAAFPVHTGSSLLWGLWVQYTCCTQSRSIEVPGSQSSLMWEGQGGCSDLFLGFQTAL